MIKPKIVMITDYGWWDTDITIISYLKQFYELEMHIITSAENDSNKFSPEDIVLAMDKYEINIRLWKRSKRIRSLQNLKMYFKLFGYIKRNSNKNALIYYIYIYDPYINILMLFNRRKKLISIHDYKQHYEDNLMRWALKHITIKTNNFFHFFSVNEYEKFINDYPKKASFYTNMPLKDYGSPPKNAINISNDLNKRVFLFFGYLRPYKGLDLLLAALEQLNRNDYLLIIAGNPDNWEDYKDTVARNPNIISHIRFIGNEQIPDYFSKSDFLILPYRKTTQSGPIFIALNYNLPVIASDLGFFKAIIDDNKNGYLFTHEDIESLKDVIIKAIELPEKSYQSMRESQKQKAIEYSQKVENTGKCFHDFIEENLHLDKTTISGLPRAGYR